MGYLSTGPLFGIHSSSIVLFRHILGFVVFCRGLLFLTVESPFIAQNGIIDKTTALTTWSELYPRFNLFLMCNYTDWSAFLVCLYMYFGLRLLLSGKRPNLHVCGYLYLLNVSLNAHVLQNCMTGDIIISMMLLFNALLPKTFGDSHPKWHSNTCTVAIYIVVVAMYFFSGLHKVYDINWTKKNALQTNLMRGFGSKLGLYVAENYPTICKLLQHGTFFIELFVPFFLLLSKTKLIATLILFSFHFGIYLSMVLGLFPICSICFLSLFLPPSFFNRLCQMYQTTNGCGMHDLLSLFVPRSFFNRLYFMYQAMHGHDTLAKTMGVKIDRGAKHPTETAGMSHKRIGSEEPIQIKPKSEHFNKPKSFFDIIPLFYAFIFVFASYDHFVADKILQINTLGIREQLYSGYHSQWKVKLRSMSSLLDTPSGWSVFTNSPHEQDSTVTRMWYNIVADVCATVVVEDGDIIEEGNVACDWVELKDHLGKGVFREKLFQSLTSWIPSILTTYVDERTLDLGYYFFFKGSGVSQPYNMALPYPSFQEEYHVSNGYGFPSYIWFSYVTSLVSKPEDGARFGAYICNKWNAVSSNKYNYKMKTIKFIHQWQFLNFDESYNYIKPNACDDVHGNIVFEYNCEEGKMQESKNSLWNGECYMNLEVDIDLTGRHFMPKI